MCGKHITPLHAVRRDCTCDHTRPPDWHRHDTAPPASSSSCLRAGSTCGGNSDAVRCAEAAGQAPGRWPPLLTAHSLTHCWGLCCGQDLGRPPVKTLSERKRSKGRRVIVSLSKSPRMAAPQASHYQQNSGFSETATEQSTDAARDAIPGLPGHCTQRRALVTEKHTPALMTDPPGS